MNRKRILTGVVAVTAVLLMTATASAGGAQVTRGEFAPFAAGVGVYEIGGHAQMVRTASGETMVTVTVGGLEAGATYGSHVHNQACALGSAGGHYSFGHAVPGGAHASGSEIWPGPFTANPAGRALGWTVVGETAGPEAVSVVIHAPDGSKIACADLS